MKNFLLIAFIALSYTISAQDIVLTPNPLTEWVTNSDIEILGDGLFKNDSAVEKTYRWERTVLCETENTETWFCDPNVCYLPTQNDAEFTLGAGEEGPFQLHATFESPDNRSLLVQIRVAEVGNQGSAVSMIYDLNSCEVISSTEELEIKDIKLFPNPTTDQFSLTNIGNIQDVVIHNIIGARVKQYLAEEGASYSISDLPSGVYMVQLIDANGNNVGSKRVFKQ